jgi:hypothetical protein
MRGICCKMLELIKIKSLKKIFNRQDLTPLQNSGRYNKHTIAN